jgi:O-antigen/teichoic acid export membrane protein
VLVGAYLGVGAGAVYAVAVRLSDYQRRLRDQFSGMLFSVAVGLDADRTPDRLRAALLDGTRVATTLVVGVTIAMLGFAQPLVRHWMGAPFDGSVAPLVVLAFVGVVLVASASAHSILLATGSQRLVATIWITEAVADLALSLALLRPFGSVGVAIGTAGVSWPFRSAHPGRAAAASGRPYPASQCACCGRRRLVRRPRRCSA